MISAELLSTRCAICGILGNTTELYPANFDWQALNPVVFSARRLPDQIHYRIVKCNICGLIRSDPIAPPEILNHLYVQSGFNYNEEILNLQQTYGYYLNKLSKYSKQKGPLLEIGCGNGFYLDEALAQGYLDVYGVEPSIAAVMKSPLHIQPKIVCDIFRPGLFEAGQFQIICMFQLLDHISNPAVLLDECFRLLKPGGLVLCLNHNVEALSAQLLKARSPIIDIEHTYLYSPTTIRRIFEKHNFQVKTIGAVLNRYTLYYLLRLVPLPTFIKRPMLAILKHTFTGKIPLSVPLGNLYLIAQKPHSNQS